MGPGRDSEGRFLKRAIRLVEHKRCITWSADPAEAEKAIHMCDLDRAGTNRWNKPCCERLQTT